MTVPSITIVGGGLAGCEAAWQAASRGVSVTLYERRPGRSSAVHRTGLLAELVCSNSLRSDKLDNAVGLLKEEMRRLRSLVIREADRTRVPAGAALAVDRERFAEAVTSAIEGHPLVVVRREEVTTIPTSSMEAPVILATGPLTSDELAAGVAAMVGRHHLAFYDAISPIVLAESIDHDRVFRASRWGRSLGAPMPDTSTEPAASGEGDYLNCPFTREEYERFYAALMAGERAQLHDPDSARFFEGCLPIEVMAERGADTLRFGPMKPVGLVDPRTGRQPYAVVQLRQDNLAGDHFSLVGFQTQLKWGEQSRVFRLIPGLERAEFVRFGMVHRNTYVNAPLVLDSTWTVRGREGLFLAGQVSGVEGYVESAASGLMAGINATLLALGRPTSVPPPTTAMGALAHYVSHADPRHYEPTNITFGIIAPLESADRRLRRNRVARNLALADRALSELTDWVERTTLRPPDLGSAIGG